MIHKDSCFQSGCFTKKMTQSIFFLMEVVAYTDNLLLTQIYKALKKYKRPKMKRDARQKCSLFLRKFSDNTVVFPQSQHNRRTEDSILFFQNSGAYVCPALNIILCTNYFAVNINLETCTTLISKKTQQYVRAPEVLKTAFQEGQMHSTYTRKVSSFFLSSALHTYLI